MRIEFKKVEMHNFMSFADEVFSFSSHPGMNLVCGKNNDIPGSSSTNGCGKSQLFDSLCYSLYGQTRNSIKNANIHNKYVSGKDMRVVASFAVDGEDWRVASGFTKHGAPYCELWKVAEDGTETDMTKSTIAETRKFLETELLHCDLPMFLRTVLLSSDQNYNFFRLRKGEKKEFIEKLFDISVFGDMYAAIHRDILDLDKEMVAQQSRMLVLSKSHDEYKFRMEKHKESSQRSIDELSCKIAAMRSSLEQLQEKSVKSSSDEVKRYEDASSKISAALAAVSQKMHKLDAQCSKIEVAVHKLESTRDQKQRAIDKHADLLSKLCGTCQKVFSQHYQIDAYTDEIVQCTASMQQHNIELASLKEQSGALAAKSKLLEEKLAKAAKKIASLTAEATKAKQEAQRIETSIAVAESELSKLRSAANPYVELLESNMKDMEAESAKLEEASRRYQYLKFAESVVSQDTLRKFIISDLIGLLNNKIKMYLSKFGAKFSVVFDANMDYIFQTEGGTCEYDNFSAGERARLMIAACFAFRDFMHIRNNLSSNILILDEFIDGAIDSVAIESILEILKGFSESWSQSIFVISHRKEINNDVFDGVIQVVKTGNIAELHYEDKR